MELGRVNIMKKTNVEKVKENKKSKTDKFILFGFIFNTLVIIIISWSSGFFHTIAFLLTKELSYKRNIITVSETNNSDYDLSVNEISIRSCKNIKNKNNKIIRSEQNVFTVSININCNKNTMIYFPENITPSHHQVSEMIDDCGKKLFYSGEKRNINEKGYYNRISLWDSSFSKNEEQIGNLSISGLSPHKDTKNIAILKGHIIAFEAIETKKYKIDKLTLPMKEINIDNILKFKFTEIENNNISCGFKYTNTEQNTPILVKFYSCNDKLLPYYKSGSGGSLGYRKMSFRVLSKNSIEKPAYAIIEYVTKSKTVKVPFEFKNIPLP